MSFPSAGKVRVAFGKVEYGQGVVTALAQIAAEELDVAMGQLIVINAASGAVPNEGMTVGSMSIETSGASVRAASAEVRALFVAEAARRLGCAAEELDICDGAFLKGGKASGLDYWNSRPTSISSKRRRARRAGRRPIVTAWSVRRSHAPICRRKCSAVALSRTFP